MYFRVEEDNYLTDFFVSQINLQEDLGQYYLEFMGSGYWEKFFVDSYEEGKGLLERIHSEKRGLITEKDLKSVLLSMRKWK